MPTYIVAHGTYDPSKPQININPELLSRIRFYAQSDHTVSQRTSVGLASLDAWGHQIETYSEDGSIPNYELRAVEGSSVDAFYVSMPETADILFVGHSGTAPIMYLCGEDGAGCHEGNHDCTGILGFFPDQELDFAFCREPQDGGPPDTSLDHQLPDIQSTIDYCNSLITSDSGGPAEQLYNGEFASYVYSLSEETIAAIRLDQEGIDDWFELRSAWTASEGFAEGALLGKYVLSHLGAAGPVTRARKLLADRELYAAIPTDYQNLIYMLDRARTEPDEFRQAYIALSHAEREMLLETPVLARFAHQLCGDVDNSPVIAAARTASSDFQDARALALFVMARFDDQPALQELLSYGSVHYALPPDFAEQLEMVIKLRSDEADFVHSFMMASDAFQTVLRANELLREGIERLIPADAVQPNAYIKAAWGASDHFRDGEKLGQHAVSVYPNLEGVKALLAYEPLHEALPENYQVLLRMLLLFKESRQGFIEAYRQAGARDRSYCKAHSTLRQIIMREGLDQVPPPAASAGAPRSTAGPSAAPPSAQTAPAADADAEELGRQAIALHDDLGAMKALRSDSARFAALPEKYRVQLTMLILRKERSRNFAGEYQGLNQTQREHVQQNALLMEHIKTYCAHVLFEED
ncbi:hypothetical protein ACIP6P_10590 [Streptomyces sp. NPDC088729]|uniref:hypothetical protein n=1 Tax=Streptomyces sp. NPDC088729 TaxID=3365876 RepID=UPI00382C70C7